METTRGPGVKVTKLFYLLPTKIKPDRLELLSLAIMLVRKVGACLSCAPPPRLDFWGCILNHNTLFSSQLKNGPNKLECLSQTGFSSLVYVLHSNLLGPFVTYEEN